MFRLKSVYIKDYKNIQDQTFDFSSNTGYIALIGLNGSGKSNLLEAISLIFNELYNIKHSEYDNVKGYRITYEIDGTSYTYTTLDEHNNIIPLDKGDRIFPSSVIACYSGEDPRLWSMAYRPYYLGFFSNALHGKDYVPKTMYINKYCWKIALISLLFSLDRDVQQFVKNVLHIDVKNVTIQFTYNDIANPQPHDAYNWLNRVKKKFGVDKIKFTDLRDFGLENIKHMDLTEDKLIFYYLYFLHLPNKTPNQPIDKLISTISIKLDSIEFDSLSEGQKKMILIACITRILGDENSLVLLDEPDAYVHIENKKAILETITQYNGQTILTTHSAVMCNLVTETKNIMLLNDGKNTDTSKLEQLKKLSGGYINYFNGSLLLNSNNPLVLVEGVGDINYIRKAIDLLSDRHPSYVDISWDMLFMGGAGENAKQFISEIRPNINEQRKVIVIFDRDESGAEAMNKLGYSGNRNDYKTYKNGNWYFMMLPKTAGYTELDFTIEDYFSLDYKKKIAKDKIDESGGFFKKLPKDLRQNVKDALGKNMKEYQANDMANFAILIDKIINILNGTDTDIEEK